MFLVIAIFLAAFALPDGWRLPAIGIGAALELAETAISIWVSSRAPVKVGAEMLVGSAGRVVEACRPIGGVRVNGEVWRARCEAGAEVDDPVRVTDRIGLTLVVERLDG